MPLKKYKSKVIFMGLSRCKKRAYGQGTTSPPVSSLFQNYSTK